MNYLVDMLNTPPKQAMKPPKAKTKRSTEKAREANKTKTRDWFNKHLNTQTLSTSQIASKRGQDNASCLPLLYDLEEDGFIVRAGRGEKAGRGQKPVLWKLTNPPIIEETEEAECLASN